MEYLLNLDYDEIILLQDINEFFRNEHFYHDGTREERLFEIADQIIDKMADGKIPLNIEDYYFGDIDNEMDHANPTLMKHLLRDAGSFLYKKMYNPQGTKWEKQAEQIKSV